MQKRIIPIVGMACAVCSGNVERKLNSINGVKSATVSLPGRSASIEYDANTVTLQQIKDEIQSIGYDMIIEDDRSSTEIEKRSLKRLTRNTILSWTFALSCMSISMGWIKIGNSDYANQIMFIIAITNIIICGRQFYSMAFKQFINMNANMDTLVTLSTAITFLFSAFNTFYGDSFWGVRGIEWHTYYDSSVMIITFVLTGKLLEEHAKNGTASAIRSLMGLVPKTAHLVQDGEITDVPISTIEEGDYLEVRIGEKIPVDGIVTKIIETTGKEGTYIDESMITGEPIPVIKRIDDKVLTGTIIKQGTLRMKAQEVGEKTMLANIIRIVQQAQNTKAPVQRTVDKIARYFVPIVILLSVITFILWYFFGGTDHLAQAILSAVSVLVIACPCAMGLATPTAIMVGIGKAAQRNILIKDVIALENTHKINALVIDKTGTLTEPNRDIDFTLTDNLKPEMRETIKPYATEAISELRKNGIDVYMISGDKEDAVKYWADKVGINHYKSGAMPQDKENLVKSLQQQGKFVAMVGDGINDSQALAISDVSIAMGQGTDVAIDVAQLTLIGTDLRNISEAIKLSHQTVKMIYENLFWAFIYNIICIPLAAGVLLLFGINFRITPMWASALMAFSSASVVLNSLRLKYMK